MNRRIFLSSSALAALTAASPPLLAQSPSPKPATQPPANPSRRFPAPFDSAPVLQNPAQDAITILTAVNQTCTAWVEYASAGPNNKDTTPILAQRADNSTHGLLPFDGRVHRFRLDNLKPNTTYHYRVVACPIDFKGPYKIERKAPVHSDTFSFTTLGDSPTASFAVINDTHETPPTLSGVTALLARHNSDLAFWNGDIFNDIRSDDQIVANLMRPADAPYAAQTPLCFVSGNHDVRGLHARSLSRFTDMPDNRRHYTLRKGPVAFIVLDTGEDKPDNHNVYAGLNDFARYRTAQQRWLETALIRPEIKDAPFRVLICHIPLFGKASSEDSRQKWHALLVAAGIDLAIHGHVHEYKYSEPDAERPWPQLVGGGPKPEGATVIHANADAKQLGVIVRGLAGNEIGNFSVRSRV